MVQACLFLPPSVPIKSGELVSSFPTTTPDSLMAASLHSKTATTDFGKDHDPEMLIKIGIFDAPVVLVKVEVTDAPKEDDESASEKGSSPWEVTLDKSEDPKTMVTWYKWAIVLIASSGAMHVTSASLIVSPAQCILPQSDLMRCCDQQCLSRLVDNLNLGTVKFIQVSTSFLFPN